MVEGLIYSLSEIAHNDGKKTNLFVWGLNMVGCSDSMAEKKSTIVWFVDGVVAGATGADEVEAERACGAAEGLGTGAK